MDDKFLSALVNEEFDLIKAAAIEKHDFVMRRKNNILAIMLKHKKEDELEALAVAEAQHNEVISKAKELLTAGMISQSEFDGTKRETEQHKFAIEKQFALSRQFLHKQFQQNETGQRLAHTVDLCAIESKRARALHDALAACDDDEA